MYTKLIILLLAVAVMMASCQPLFFGENISPMGWLPGRGTCQYNFQNQSAMPVVGAPNERAVFLCQGNFAESLRNMGYVFAVSEVGTYMSVGDSRPMKIGNGKVEIFDEDLWQQALVDEFAGAAIRWMTRPVASGK